MKFCSFVWKFIIKTVIIFFKLMECRFSILFNIMVGTLFQLIFLENVMTKADINILSKLFIKF